MTAAMMTQDWKERVRAEIQQNRTEWVQLLADVIRRPSDNPPGDTTVLATFVRETLEREGVEVQVLEPRAGNPNIVAELPGVRPGRHLILNGHLDQFPVERPELWTDDPYSGLVKEDRIYGRGAADMKGGTTALLVTTLLFKRLNVPLAGKLSLVLVSDEETGGRWGAEWLVENHPELRGDAVLNGEPTSTNAIGVAEKGVYWLKVTTRGPGGHSAAGTLDSAIFKMSTAIQTGLQLRGRQGQVPASLQGVVASSRAFLENRTPGSGWIIEGITFNVGTISGGAKVNVVPAMCTADFDFRLPVGIQPDDVLHELTTLLAQQGVDAKDISFEPLLVNPSNYTEPGAEIVQTLARNVEQVTGRRPITKFTSGGSDGRFWRYQGVPCAVFGPRDHNMATHDENILLEDYMTTIQAHAGAIIDYLGVA